MKTFVSVIIIVTAIFIHLLMGMFLQPLRLSNGFKDFFVNYKKNLISVIKDDMNEVETVDACLIFFLPISAVIAFIAIDLYMELSFKLLKVLEKDNK